MTMTLSTPEVYSQELQATVTPPSSESENLMRNVPTSLAFRNSSASCRDTNPSRALDTGNFVITLVSIQRHAPVYPHAAEVLLGELHHGVEPLPEGEAAVGERLLAEL